MCGFEGACLSDVQLSISELSVVGGWVWVDVTRQTHFMVGPGRGPTKISPSAKAIKGKGESSRAIIGFFSSSLETFRRHF